MKYYLAIDIGASGGRHILGHMENGLMVTEEIYRFDNGAVRTEGELLWDTDHIFTEILSGLKACKTAGKIPVSVGIDTWGCDPFRRINKQKARVAISLLVATTTYFPRSGMIG